MCSMTSVLSNQGRLFMKVVLFCYQRVWCTLGGLESQFQGRFGGGVEPKNFSRSLSLAMTPLHYRFYFYPDLPEDGHPSQY